MIRFSLLELCFTVHQSTSPGSVCFISVRRLLNVFLEMGGGSKVSPWFRSNDFWFWVLNMEERFIKGLLLNVWMLLSAVLGDFNQDIWTGCSLSCCVLRRLSFGFHFSVQRLFSFRSFKQRPGSTRRWNGFNKAFISWIYSLTRPPKSAKGARRQLAVTQVWFSSPADVPPPGQAIQHKTRARSLFFYVGLVVTRPIAASQVIKLLRGVK